MRSLSESLHGNSTVTNKERLVNEAQQQEINNLINEVDGIKDDINEINDTLNEPVINKSAANFTGAVNANEVNAVDSEFTNVSATNIGATNIDATNVDADEIDVGRLEATTTVATNSTITNATITNADITDANITNFSVDNFTADEITAEDITADDVVVNNSISADVANVPTINATDIDAVTLDATTVNGTNVNATDLSATYGTVNTLGNQILKSKFIEHDDYYIDINQVVSDTDFIVIELPNIKTGDYRLTYYNSQMTDILFSFALNDTKENKWFSYSRALDQKSFDQVAIKDGKLYIKTWYTGRLYFHSDTLDNIIAPKTYAEWPIDVEDLDYPLFTATRIKATVYTHFVNIGMDDQEYGTAVFSYNTTNDWSLVKDQLDNANPIEYDPQTDVLAYNYIPDQNVNVDSNVEFGDVEADNVKINGTVGHTGLEISNIENGQILRKRLADTQMTAENPVDVSTDDQPLSRLSDGILTERTVTNWNGATNRQYQPGVSSESTEAVFLDSVDFNNPTDYGTSESTSVPNVYKLTSNGDITYYKSETNVQTTYNLVAGNSFNLSDWNNIVNNTPAGYTLHCTLDEPDVDYTQYELLNNTTGAIAIFSGYKEEGTLVAVYASDYIGISDAVDDYFESIGLLQDISIDASKIVSYEWNDDYAITITYLADYGYKYLDKFWGNNWSFPAGTPLRIDGGLTSSSVSASGATFNYVEYQYIPTATDYDGPTAQNCTIDASGNVSPSTITVHEYNYKRYFREPSSTSSYLPHETSKAYYGDLTTPVADPTALADSLFTADGTPSGTGTAYNSDWKDYPNNRANKNGYVMWHSDSETSAVTNNLTLYDATTSSAIAVMGNGPDVGGYFGAVVNDNYKVGFIRSTDDWTTMRNAQRPYFTPDELDTSATPPDEYVYFVSSGGQYKYARTDTRNDSYYTNRPWNWSGWSAATSNYADVCPTGYSYTQAANLENSDTVVRAYKKQADYNFKFNGQAIRVYRDTTYEYDRTAQQPASNWAVYWEADLGSGHDFYEDEGAVGNKYIFLNDGDPIPNPLSGGYTYNGGRVNITGHDRLITYKSNPYSVSVDTLDFNLVDKVLPTVSDPVYSSSITHVGKIIEGEWDAGQLNASGDITSTGNLSVAGNAEIGGDLNVAGTITTVHSEEVTTEENTIELRHDAQVGLIGNETSGLIINNYDGNNNDAGILLDSSGTLRIGDIGDTEPVATRDETANLVNDNLLKWDSTGNRLVDSGKSLDDIADDIEAAKNSISEINGWTEYLERVNPSSAPTNITQIATQVQGYMTTLGVDCVVFKALMTTAQCLSYLGLTFSAPKMLVYTCDKSSGTVMNSATLSALDDYVYFNRYDFTNNTWTLANKYNKACVTPGGLGAIYLDRPSPDGSVIIGDKNGRHLELGESYYYGYNYGIPTLHAKTGDVWNSDDMLLLRSTNVWVPDGLRIPTTIPQNPQPGNIWVII